MRRRLRRGRIILGRLGRRGWELRSALCVGYSAWQVFVKARRWYSGIWMAQLDKAERDAVSDSLNGAYPSFRALKKARLVRIWIFMGDEFSPVTQRFKKLNVGYNHHR